MGALGTLVSMIMILIYIMRMREKKEMIGESNNILRGKRIDKVQMSIHLEKANEQESLIVNHL